MTKEAAQEQLQKKIDTVYAVKSQDGSMIQDVDSTSRTVTGFFNSYNFIDGSLDVIRPGAFDKSIKEHGPGHSAKTYGIKHLLFHDWNKVLSKPHVLQSATKTVKGAKISGLYFESKMPKTEDGNDTLIKYAEEVYDQHSIGFVFLAGEYLEYPSDGFKKMLDKLDNPEVAEAAGRMWVWDELKLFEGSTVAFGDNEMTPALGVKGRGTEANALLLIKLAERLDILEKDVTSGDVNNIEQRFSRSMQIAQIKQIMREIVEGRSADDTEAKGRQKQKPENTYRRFGSLV